jgi:5-oxoprolinase (ATP-hydrolysing)
MQELAGWEFWVDRGGTFTDVIGRAPDGRLVARKVPSADPLHAGDAIVRGISAVLDTQASGTRRIRALKIGTTVATNALLERRGARTAVLLTHGFADVLRIGEQHRPELFALDIQLPEPLWETAAEAHERMDADGTVLEPLDEARLQQDLAGLRRQGFATLAICLLHGYRHPAHERRAGALARAAGFTQVSLSHEVSPLIRYVARGDTTVADAYLSPVLHRYVEQLEDELAAAGLVVGQLLFMQSNGGLTTATNFRGANSVLSGPAGGVAGMAAALLRPGRELLVGFDMGGTSTDISLYAGGFETSSRNEVAGVRLALPMLRVHTIAAGGGSLLHFADGRCVVGPESAGAHPGPACYRRGGPLAVTDANLLLGRLVPAAFPAVFGDGSQALDPGIVRERFTALAAEVTAATGCDESAEALAAGFLRVAVDNMAGAIRQVALRRGQDVRDFVLCPFGGAAGQLACLVAAELGIRRVLLHPLAGLLSACGIGLSPLRALRQRGIEQDLDEALLAQLPALVDELGAECADELLAQGVVASEICQQAVAELRVAGSDTSLPVPLGEPGRLAQDFAGRHRSIFGFAPAPGATLVLTALRVEADGATAALPPSLTSNSDLPAGTPPASQPLHAGGRWQDAVIVPRAGLATGQRIDGPVIIVEANTTTVVDPGWRATVEPAGSLLLEPLHMPAPPPVTEGPADPVLLEIINNRFMHVAGEMGVVLEQTASSVNIKERRDFSCALFDCAGRLLANAPHIPVHLGSMGDAVRSVLARGLLGPGAAVMLNSPYAGGTHLPDVTVVSALHDETGAVRFIVANRAHHTDIGGLTPGSMPAASTSIEQEGVLFTGFPLLEHGRLREEALRQALAGGPLPARDPERNLADLRAQLAANARGIAQLQEMLAQFGAATVQRYTVLVRENAAGAVRELVSQLEEGELACTLDGGECIRVRIMVDRAARRLSLDFTGTSPQSAGNLNAPAAVTRACVLYVLRCLLGKAIPLNEGCFEPLEIRLPPGSLLDPRWPAAVVAGNVETSQAVANLLLGALGRLAAGQGTMNNLSFGDQQTQYYETIGGGAGAGAGHAGASGVHTHMTNSRITDAEILESRLPVLLRGFALRRGSGGAGRHRGGDGLVRRIEFRTPLTLSLLTGSRIIAPFGLAGGEPGACGRNHLRRADGSELELPGTCELVVGPGDTLTIETPGGGGFGAGWARLGFIDAMS